MERLTVFSEQHLPLNLSVGAHTVSPLCAVSWLIRPNPRSSLSHNQVAGGETEQSLDT